MGQELGKIDGELASQAKALEKSGKELDLEMTQAGLSAAGVVDPTPISDTINAGISFARGDVVGGVIDLASGWLPYIGDSLKVLKAGKVAKKIADLKKQIETATEWMKKYNDWRERAREAAKRVRESRKAKACEKECKNKWGTQVPAKGKWDGEHGNSKWTSEDGKVSVEYKEGYPDFKNAKGPNEGPVVLKEVEIPQTGNNNRDFGAANKEAGYKDTPKNYTWHHKEDGVTMQLVRKDVHDKTIGGAPHTGGGSVVRDQQF